MPEEEKGESLGQKAAGAAKWSILTQVISRLISPVTAMILARLLAPEAFGVVATATMVTSLADIISDAGFQKYLVQHDFKSAEERSLSACVAFWTNLAVSLTLVALIATFRDPLAEAVGNPGLGMVLVAASASLPLTSLVSVQTALFQRDLDFKVLFASKVGSSLLILFVSVPLALLGLDYWSMVIGTIASNLLLAVWLTVKSEWKPRLMYSLAELGRMLSFGLWILFEAAATWVNTWAGTFILGAVMSAYYVGLYKTSTSICSAIMSVFTASILPVAFSALSKVQADEQRFEHIFFKMQRYLCFCIIPISFFSLVYRHALTFILLGDQWGETELFFGLWMFTGCIVIVSGYMCSEAYRAKGRPELCVLVQVAYLFPFLPALWWSATVGFECVTYVMPLLRIVMAAINVTVARVCLGLSPWKMIVNAGPSFLQSAIAMLPGFVVLFFTDSLVVELLMAVPSIVLYVVILFMSKRTRQEAYELIDRIGARPLAKLIKRVLRQA